MDTIQTLNLELQSASGELVNKVEGWISALVLQLPNLVLATLIFLAGVVITRFMRRGVKKTVARYSDNQTIVNLASNVTAVIFSVILGLIILSVFNLDGAVNKFLATAGILGLAVGLALQDPLTNLFSGVLMSVRDMYNIGDIVETNGFFGTIQTISLRSTVIATPQGQRVTIPNKDVIQNPLINYSILGNRRLDLVCGVSYGEDLEEVERIVLDCTTTIDGVNTDKPIKCYFTGFGDSSIDLVLQVWTEYARQPDFLKFKSDAIKSIKKAFDKSDISIPFPIRTLDFGIKGGVPLKSMLQSKSLVNGL